MKSARQRLASTTLDYYPLSRLAETGFGDPTRLPMTVKILLEGLLREADSGRVSETSLRALTRWPERPPAGAEVPYLPARVLLQDFTGVPAVVDLAAMRSAMQRAGKDAGRIDPLVQADLVIDHSVQVDAFGSLGSYARNIEREYARNGERYALLRWAQQAFHNFSVVPPGMGICHQVNLERLSRVVQVRKDARGSYALPDTLLGTDSHTTMVNGLGVLGWGVGGIEAEAALLGQPTYLPTPVVVGVRMTGALRPGATATDLVLTLTEMLRKHGVVNKVVEFCGGGLASLSVSAYGRTTCNANSGPLASAEVEAAVEKEKLNVVAVLSGNRNFEGRIHPLVRASYLASPPLVVAYALAGDIRRNLATDPLGTDKDGKNVFLRELWPSAEEVNEAIRTSLKVEMFTREYARIFDGDENWQRMSAPTGPSYAWDPTSTYVREPPFFDGMTAKPLPLTD